MSKNVVYHRLAPNFQTLLESDFVTLRRSNGSDRYKQIRHTRKDMVTFITSQEVRTYSFIPVHAWNVAPEVARSVSRADLHSVNKNRITLKQTHTLNTLTTPY